MPSESRRVGSEQSAVGKFLDVKMFGNKMKRAIAFGTRWGSGITPTYVDILTHF